MRVSIYASPIFYFDVSRQLVDQLLRMSKLHYDGECQRASARVGRPLHPGSTINQSSNGVLTIWSDYFERDAKPEATATVRAVGNDLDLIAKICEYPPQPCPEYQLAADFRKQILKILEVAGPKTMNEWKMVFDV